jgi:hypothetical protein
MVDQAKPCFDHSLFALLSQRRERFLRRTGGRFSGAISVVSLDQLGCHGQQSRAEFGAKRCKKSVLGTPRTVIHRLGDALAFLGEEGDHRSAIRPAAFAAGRARITC